MVRLISVLEVDFSTKAVNNHGVNAVFCGKGGLWKNEQLNLLFFRKVVGEF